MVTYIFKTILCSAFLILIYHLFLEKEKMHRFNRFYLLSAIAFSFIVPLITINIKFQSLPVSKAINISETILPSSLVQQVQQPINDSFSLSSILLLLYVTVTAFLFLRFILNFSVILFKIWDNKSVKYFQAKLILIKDSQVPHSFLNYVFVHFKDFELGTIENEILSHELAHVKQKHSLDILFIELLMIFGWINPFVFCYRRTIRLNHEYLADEFVVKNFNDANKYQLLLVEKATKSNNLLLSSSFNYLLTKKRIIMMTKETSPKIAILKQVALIPVIVITAFLLTTKIIAQNISEVVQEQILSTQDGVSPELLNEYQDIEKKYTKTAKDGGVQYWFNLTQADRERLETIYFQMSTEQQTKQVFVFWPCTSMVLPQQVPTKEQIESFKDPKKYGVWIDGEQVNNKDLDGYKNTDFASCFESKLMKNAKNYGIHEFQVNLLTNEEYQKYLNDKVSEGNCLTINTLKASKEVSRPISN